MGRSPCCDETGLTKGHWTPEEDRKLKNYILKHGHGSWRALPKQAGLNRCGKSCRLRWTNYLRPDIKRGPFTETEDKKIIHLHSHLGNKWSTIATELDGRTDNEIKNYWNTHLRKKLLQMGIDPVTHRPRADLTLLATIPNLLAAAAANLGAGLPSIRLQADYAQLAKEQFIQSLVQVLSSGYNINSTTAGSSSTTMTTGPPLPSNDFQNMNQLLLLNGYNNPIGECRAQVQGQGTGFVGQVPTQTVPVCTTAFTDIASMAAGVADQPPSLLPSYNFQHMNDHEFNSNMDRFGVDQNNNIGNYNGRSYSQMSSPCTNQTSTASIVSNSPDNFNIDQMHANSSTMNSSEDQPWGNTNFDDYLSSNFNWNDLLGQSCLPTWSSTL